MPVTLTGIQCKWPWGRTYVRPRYSEEYVAADEVAHHLLDRATNENDPTSLVNLAKREQQLAAILRQRIITETTGRDLLIRHCANGRSRESIFRRRPRKGTCYLDQPH